MTTLHQASVPVFEQFLHTLSAQVDKASAFAESRKISDVDLLGWRLYPDMLPLVAQFLTACDTAKNATARLAGAEAPRFEDNEKTFDEVRARIAKTLAYIRGVPAADVDAGAKRELFIPTGPTTKVRMLGADYFYHRALPNFFFHVVTAHDILRHNGVEIGKRDFFGAVPGAHPA
jgi:hypothetical protein